MKPEDLTPTEMLRRICMFDAALEEVNNIKAGNCPSITPSDDAELFFLVTRLLKKPQQETTR